jgi:hypothetical protein
VLRGPACVFKLPGCRLAGCRLTGCRLGQAAELLGGRLRVASAACIKSGCRSRSWVVGGVVVKSRVPSVELLLPWPLDADVRHVDGDVHGGLKEGEVVAAGNRPPHVVVLDDVHGVLDVLPVKVNVSVKVDLVGEECAHCWLDVAGEDAIAGFVCSIAQVSFPPKHWMVMWCVLPYHFIRDSTKVKACVQNNPSEEIDTNLAGG